MRITTVTYTKTFNLGNYCSEKIGVEISINEAEDAKLGLIEAKKLVEEYHKESVAETPMVNTVVSVPFEEITEIKAPPKSSKEKQEQTLIDSINSCLEIKVLESYRLIAKSKPELQQAYDNKLQSLQK